MAGDIVETETAVLKVFFDIAQRHVIHLMVVAFHRRIQLLKGRDTKAGDPFDKLLIGFKRIKLFIYFQDLLLQVRSVQIHLIQEFQDPAQERVNADEDKVLVLDLFCKILKKRGKPFLNGLFVFGTDQLDQFLFCVFHKGKKAEFFSKSISGVENIFMGKEEAVSQGMGGAGIGSGKLPETLCDPADPHIQRVLVVFVTLCNL